MTPKDRHTLASAYMSAWAAVHHSPCVVNPVANGWFEVLRRPSADKWRAAQLIKSLAALTQRLEKQAEANRQGTTP